jgi:hypothetical protein
VEKYPSIEGKMFFLKQFGAPHTGEFAICLNNILLIQIYIQIQITNVFISNQGPIKGKVITMIKYMNTMCNVYTQYNVTFLFDIFKYFKLIIVHSD